jgi:predicted kinase
MIATVPRSQIERDVARILEHTGTPPSRRRPALLVLAGLPGAGKTSIASELRRRTGAAVLESDAIRSLLAPARRYTQAEHRRVFAAIHASIERLLSNGAPVIVDATNLAQREREPLYELAGRCGAKLIVAHVTAPDDVIRARLARRPDESTHSEADIRIYEEMQWRYEPIRRPHREIDTSGEIEPALRALAKEME